MVPIMGRHLLAALLTTIVGSPCSSFAAPLEKYSCENGYFLDRWIGSDGVQGAHWSREIELKTGEKVRAGGGYMKGHKIRLGDLALWLDREIPERGVWIFRGTGNSVTQMSILILNEHTQKVAIVNVGTMSSDIYQCKLVGAN
jgi:hypothetical protein